MPFRAALAYFALIFAAGFVLGTIRVTLFVPYIGDLRAVILELPVMLALSWLAAGWLIHRHSVPSGGPRLAMGALAFGLLMLAEVLLATVFFGQTPWQVLAQFATPPGALGLAGQVGFGVMPWLCR